MERNVVRKEGIVSYKVEERCHRNEGKGGRKSLADGIYFYLKHPAAQ
jgi:hypothetical protein